MEVPYLDPDRKRQWDREALARRRAEWFADKECWRCGSATDLRLDHRDPSEKVSHRVWSWSKARRAAELAKCQVLCEPCHRWKTTLCGEDGAKLDQTSVLRIRRLFASGEVSKVSLANYFGVDERTIRDLLARRSWTWL